MSAEGSDRFQRLAAILDEAPEDTDPATLSAWLDAACGDDAELREQASELLEHRDEVPSGFLAPPHARPAARPTPRRIGPFEVSARLGHGGMGEVYRARDPEADREVAIKVVHAAATDEVLARFETERRMLARMSHPGIARVLSVGRTGEGEPWLAMELVPDPVDVVTDADRRGLDLRARVEAMAGVCDAVHHAHQKGVVHRDLKPGNVVVSGVPAEAADGPPRPRVIDFGVARLVDEAASLDFRTRVGQLIGTQAYMAPEQARDPAGADVRSDVFALGTVLYELVTGRRAFRSAGGPPAVPPAAAGGPFPIPADLDLVVRTAIAEEPDLRYGSAEALAADLRRVLADEPVAARPPTAAYLVRKFVRRHRASVAASAAGLLLLAAVAAVATAQAIRASRAEAATARFAYRAGVVAAASAVAQRDGATAAALLDEVPRDRRGWEWWHLDRLARGHAREVHVSAIWTQTIDHDADGRVVVKPQLARPPDRTAPPTRAGDLLVLAADGMAIDREARRAVTWSERELRIVDTASGDVVSVREPPFDVAAARLDDQRITALGTDGGLRTTRIGERAWTDLAMLAGLDLAPRTGAPGAVAVALGRRPDGRIVVLTTREVRTVDPGGDAAPVRIPIADAAGTPALSADARLLVTGHRDHRVRVRDAASGTIRHELALPERPFVVTIDPAATRVAAGTIGGTAVVLDLATGAPVGRPRIGHAGAVTAVAFDPSGSLLTADLAGSVRRWTLDATSHVPVELAHDGAVTDLAFTEDGRLHTLSLADGRRTWASPGAGPVAAAAPAGVSPDTWRLQPLPGGGVAEGTVDGRVVVRRDAAATEVAGLAGGQVQSMAVSPDGTRLAVASTGSGATVIDLASLEPRPLPALHAEAHVRAAFDVAWLDDRRLAVAEPNVGVVLHEPGARPARVLHRADFAWTLAVLGPRRLLVGTGDGGLVELDPVSGAVRRRLGGHDRGVSAIATTPDGRRLITADDAGAVVVRDRRDGRSLLRLGGTGAGAVLSLAISPDGRAIATGHTDGRARVWAIAPPWGPPAADVPVPASRSAAPGGPEARRSP